MVECTYVMVECTYFYVLGGGGEGGLDFNYTSFIHAQCT